MPHLQPVSVDASFYAVVVPQWSRFNRDDKGRPILEGAKVERITQQRPGTLKGGAVVTRLTLRLDAEAMLPLQPQAIIHISPGEVDVIEVTADAPSHEEGSQRGGAAVVGMTPSDQFVPPTMSIDAARELLLGEEDQ